MTNKDFFSEIKQEWYPATGTFSTDDYPVSGSMSAAFIYRLIPNPLERRTPEFVYVKKEPKTNFHENSAFLAKWNMGWEAGHLRADAFSKEIPERFNWLNKYKDSNIYLLLHSPNNHYYAHQHILNLLPASTRERYGLPRPNKGIWPSEMEHWYLGFFPKTLIQRPRMGGFVWYGEKEAWEITKQLVDLADSKGSLRSIIDVVRSNRVQDDFSNLWSYEKEDFERKIYHKRNKIKVSFVEIDSSIPVHGPTAEIHEQLIWEDFFAVLNPKEKSIMVCLKNGVTKLSEIGETLGYSNHNPVSKALKKIRIKAMQMLDVK